MAAIQLLLFLESRLREIYQGAAIDIDIAVAGGDCIEGMLTDSLDLGFRILAILLAICLIVIALNHYGPDPTALHGSSQNTGCVLRRSLMGVAVL